MYTRAQLELMSADVQITVYKAREKDKPRKGEYRKPDKAKMDEAWRKWKLRKAKGAFDLKKFLGNQKKENGEQQSEQETQK